MFCIKKQAVAMLTALALCAGTTWVAAEDKREPANDSRIEAAFKKLDVNGDGKLTLVEYKAEKVGEEATKAEAEFKAMDKDVNGSLTLEEYKAGQPKKKEEKKEPR